MEILSDKIVKQDERDAAHAPCYTHHCPGCERTHHIAVDVPFHNGARWTYNGNPEKPTFEPSMNISCGPFPEDGHIERCHYFLREGMLEYLSDCTHKLAGQTIPLPPFPPEKLEGFRNAQKFQEFNKCNSK